jgi:hypothetical protein
MLSEACRSPFPRLQTQMVYSKSPFYRRVILFGLAGLFFLSAVFADQPKKRCIARLTSPGLSIR